MTLPLAGTLIGQYNLILSYLEDAVQDQDDEFQEIEDSSDVIDEPSKMFCYRLIPFH